MGDVLCDASRNALLTTSRVAWLAEMRRHKQTRRWNGDVWVGHEFWGLLMSSTAWSIHGPCPRSTRLSSVVELLLGTAPQHHQRMWLFVGPYSSDPHSRVDAQQHQQQTSWLLRCATETERARQSTLSQWRSPTCQYAASSSSPL